MKLSNTLLCRLVAAAATMRRPAAITADEAKALGTTLTPSAPRRPATRTAPSPPTTAA